jgi:hypothetical protein
MTDDPPTDETLRSRLITCAEAFADAPNDFLRLIALHSAAYKMYQRAKAEREVQVQILDGAVEAVAEVLGGGQWWAVENPSAFDTDFTEIKIAFDRLLTEDEIKRVSLALEHAMDWMVKAGKMSEVDVVLASDEGTVLQYRYDSAQSTLSAPDPDAAFLLAHRYIEEGTPVRRKEGTRLVEGIGGEQIARFWVR